MNPFKHFYKIMFIACALIMSDMAKAQMILPGAQPPTPTGTQQITPPSSSAPAVKRPAVAAPPKTPTADSVIGKELKWNGKDGVIKIERSKTDLSATLSLEGKSINQPQQSCAINFGAGAMIPLSSQGSPMGLARFKLEASSCPMVFDVLDGAILVREPVKACVFTAADCQVDVRGIWGPEPRGLVAQAKQFDQARAKADTSLRENYRQLIAKAGPGQTRPIISEQASFSADRETMCRDYNAESQHGFCHVRFTEARVLSLRSRMISPER